MGCSNTKTIDNNCLLPNNLNNYKLVMLLGIGKFCHTFLFERKIKCKKSHKIVVKKYKSKKDNFDIMWMEMHIIKKLNINPNKNIIKCKVVDNAIFMEYCSKGDLFDVFKENYYLDNNTIINYIYCISCAIDHLNNLGFIHRDIKLENILITKDNNAKLCDFNLADKGTDIKRRENGIGTKGYRAPEVYLGEYYDKKCDVWSLGTVLYILYNNDRPFHRNYNGPINCNDEIKKKKRWNKIPDNIKILIKRMLLFNASERIDIKEIINVLMY